jgi:hypothetical protein
MTAIELDFLRACLTIDGQLRANVDELLEHAYFDAEFKAEIETSINDWQENDRNFREAQSQIILRCKDNRMEIPIEEIVTESEDEDEEDEEDSAYRQSYNRAKKEV